MTHQRSLAMVMHHSVLMVECRCQLSDLCHGFQQEHSLTPSCVDFIPLHWGFIGAAQAEAPNCAKGPFMPNSENIMVHIYLLQPLQMCCAVLHLQKALDRLSSVRWAQGQAASTMQVDWLILIKS